MLLLLLINRRKKGGISIKQKRNRKKVSKIVIKSHLAKIKFLIKDILLIK